MTGVQTCALPILEPKYLEPGTFDPTGYDEAPVDEVSDEIGEILFAHYNKKRASWPKDAPNEIEKVVALRCVDKNWTTHIDSMSKLREGIGLRGYAHTDPLKAYVDEGWNMFTEMTKKIAEEAVLTLLRAQVRAKSPQEVEAENKQKELQEEEIKKMKAQAEAAAKQKALEDELQALYKANEKAHAAQREG